MAAVWMRNNGTRGNHMRKFKSMLSMALVLSMVMSAFTGCMGGIFPPVTDGSSGEGSHEQQPDFPTTADLSSDFFTLAYARDTDIQNCADGLLLISKQKTFEEGVCSLTISWGDGSQAFDDYSPIAEYDNVNAAEFEYTFENNSLIPMEATKIWVEAKGEQGEALTQATLSVEAYKTKSELLYEFQVISDLHVTATGSQAFTRRSEKAFADILANSPSSAAIIVNGDIVDECTAANYDRFYETFASVYSGIRQPNFWVGLGNHEFIKHSEAANDTTNLEQKYKERLSLWKQKTGNDAPYFSYELYGSTFIFLGTTAMPRTLDGNTRADCMLGDEQIAWLKTTMENAGKSGKPIYLFSHGSLRDTVSGSLSELNQTWYGYTKEDEAAIRNIIKDYPQTLFFSSHSHWSFESQSPYLIGENYPSFFNTASVGYLWEGEGDGRHYMNGDYENGGGQGLYVEVYADQVVIKGRQFEGADGESTYWYSGYQVVLPI